jgi:4-hydroxy-L-threonine phosphate dehydrogenase PdxA
MSDKKRPVVCIVMGDACGIGPELAAKSLKHLRGFSGFQSLFVGSKSVFDMGREIASVTEDVPTFSSVEAALASDEPIVFYDHPAAKYSEITLGQNNKGAGTVDLELARYSVGLYKKNMIDGFVFGPVNKISLKMGGSSFEGYKAYIADQLGINKTSEEINTLGYLWTTRVTSHMAVQDVPEVITRDNVLDVIRYFDSELKRFGYENPKIAVSALNPHNGDGGMFGRQEIDDIAPAVEAAKVEGINVDGPMPADTIFLTVKQENYLGVVSMFHDQCQIATKLLGFDEGVTYFGGLPFPITTPAHGTAFDIAGKGVANEKPFVNAVELMGKAVCQVKS